MENNEALLGDVIHLITVIGGILVGKGFIGAEWLPVFTGVCFIALAVIWSRIYKARQNRVTANAVNIALASPSDTPPQEVMEAAKEMK